MATFQRPSAIHLVVAFIFLLSNIYYLYWRAGAAGGAAAAVDIYNYAHSLGINLEYDEKKCARAIMSAANDTAVSYETSSTLSLEQKEHAVDLIVRVAMNPDLVGDYVDVSSSSSSCSEQGILSLIAAIAQRTAMHEPYCTTQKRAIWLSFREERCVEDVKHLFEGQKFSVSTEESPLTSNDVVPIYLLVGEVQKRLPDSPVQNIALLSITAHPAAPALGENTISNAASSEDQLPEYTALHSLFSLYRKVRIQGYILLHGEYTNDQEVIEFFTDSNRTVLSFSKNSSTFMKRDTHIRVPRRFRLEEITKAIGPKVHEGQALLKEWHKETVRKFFGHVMSNPYQSYRYIEAMRSMVNLQKKRSGQGNEATVNVCETGFNGGHSAMLFMSFLDKERGINVNYWGWDLKQVGSAAPVAEKMAERYGSNFNIVWGNSHETLKQVKETMGTERCHLIVVDGDHSKKGVTNDIENYLTVAAPGAVVFGDDCAPYKRTVPQSEEMLEGWMEFVKKKQLISVANYRNPDLPSPGFVEGLVPDEDGSFNLGL